MRGPGSADQRGSDGSGSSQSPPASAPYSSAGPVRGSRLPAAARGIGIERIRAFRSAQPTGDLARQPLRVLVTAFGSDVAVASAEFVRAVSGRTVRQQ